MAHGLDLQALVQQAKKAADDAERALYADGWMSLEDARTAGVTGLVTKVEPIDREDGPACFVKRGDHRGRAPVEVRSTELSHVI